MSVRIDIKLPNLRTISLHRRAACTVTVHFLRWRYVFALLLNPTLAFGDAYTEGAVQISDEDLSTMLRSGGGRSRLWRLSMWLHYRPMNLIWLQQRYIRRHYDLSNDYFRLLFDGDPTWSYSCARFASLSDGLGQAQMEKIRNLLIKLQLEPGQRLLDIGCGWGYLAVTAAKEFDAKVLGITLSSEQLAYAQALAEREGVAHLVEFRLINYRCLAAEVAAGSLKPFNAIVSVGMFEHVGRGRRRQGRYFEVVRALLMPGGVSVLHTITNQDGAPLDPWVSRRVFPGGNLPNMEQIHRGLRTHGFQYRHAEDMFRHYAETLKVWLDAHIRHRTTIEEQWGAAFWRQGYLWLLGSISGFEVGDLGISQVVFTRGKPLAGTWPWACDRAPAAEKAHE